MRERNHTARGLKSTCETRRLDREWKAIEDDEVEEEYSEDEHECDVP